MNTEDRVEIYNELTLLDKQWLFDIILARDVLVFHTESGDLNDGSQYSTGINGTQIQLNAVPEKEKR
jgi:hypothetical protein|tara:strand:+ start:733 stop:933 length:201 start_codon:yes stop_codon:yes gene_type:complete